MEARTDALFIVLLYCIVLYCTHKHTYTRGGLSTNLLLRQKAAHAETHNKNKHKLQTKLTAMIAAYLFAAVCCDLSQALDQSLCTESISIYRRLVVWPFWAAWTRLFAGVSNGCCCCCCCCQRFWCQVKARTADASLRSMIHSFIHFFIANKCQNAFAVT